ncbi:hypothetical protein Dda_4309 [Drechslerella dactyloides]|uniref:RNase III domain-containing protein n=1 Tax=Drechslerella dactyloides TaxID=74499 RepID=A0AAD6NKC2_DREDA|nr:hypothetical protein Dda_4309 [Drechslerella dactyloides]
MVDQAKIESILGYNFASGNLLMEALEAPGRAYTHETESGIDGNKRLAMVGDALLTLIHFDMWYPSDQSRDNTYLRLQNASSWIEERIKVYRGPIKAITEVKDPQEKHRYITSGLPPGLSKGTKIEAAVSLIDFKTWIEQNLKNWCSGGPLNSRADIINFLSANIEQYHMEASRTYVNHNIFDTSRMVLTIMEMWVQLDKVMCVEQPLLLHYSPKLPSSLLEPALFIQKDDMRRLLKVEVYLCYHHSAVKESK